MHFHIKQDHPDVHRGEPIEDTKNNVLNKWIHKHNTPIHIKKDQYVPLLLKVLFLILVKIEGGKRTGSKTRGENLQRLFLPPFPLKWASFPQGGVYIEAIINLGDNDNVEVALKHRFQMSH